MGITVCRAVAAADDLDLVAAVDPGAAGEDLRSLAGDEAPGLVVGDDVEAWGAGDVEVAVDFTDAAAARRHLGWCASHGVHAVVGTSGLGADDMAAVRRQFADSGANAVLVPNFAIGAVLLEYFCELAAPFMDGVEVIELHHDGKRDAPSGTALHTAARIEEARRRAGLGPLPQDPTTLTTLPGVRGGRTPGGVHVHAVRLPGLVAHEEVLFGALGQGLTLRHDSYDRVSFMPGVLLAVRAAPTRPGVTIGLDSLLGL